MVREIIEAVCVIAALCAAAYYLLCLWSAASLLKQQQLAGKNDAALHAFSVSILKPLKGTDPEMYESFRSHCLQDYPGEYEIIFGVSEANDPAVECVERLKREFPGLAIGLIVCEKKLGTNIKVSNLAQMLPQAKFEHVVVNDSDVRVESDYLRQVISRLADQNVGLVTCLYRGVTNSGIGAELESIGISSDFCAGVLAARKLQGISFGLGSTLAFRRSDLQAVGGFENFADYLADDYELGRRISETGKRVELSEAVVETYLPRYTISGFLRHQLRWARTIRDSRFGGYLGLGVTFGIPWALLALILGRGTTWEWALFASIVALRFSVAVIVGIRVLRDRELLSNIWLLPLRDFLALFVWVASFAGHTVSWRGEKFKLQKGRLIRC